MASRLHQSIYQLSVRIRDAAGRLNRELGSVTLEENGDLGHLHQQMQGVIEEIGRVVDQLQQREHEVLRAEQLAAVGQVAAGVAHELRNPLTSVKMLVQTGLEGHARPACPPPTWPSSSTRSAAWSSASRRSSTSRGRRARSGARPTWSRSSAGP